MTRSIRLRVLAPLLLLACSCSTLSSARRTPHDITLRFDWPERFAARVSYTYAMRNPLGDREVRRQFWLTVEQGEKEGHHRLVPRDMEVFPAEYAAFVDPEPTVLFDDQGGFQGIELPEEVPGLALLEALPLEPEKKAEVRGNILARQEQEARERWKRMVTHWNGVTLTPGEWVRQDGKMVVGRNMLERDEVAAEQRVFFEAGVPCSPGEPEPRCVRLSVETEPIGQSQEKAGPMAYWKFELVTDPDTLVPYSTRMLRKDRVDLGEEGDKESLEEFQQMEEYLFTYGAEPVPSGSRAL
jgi:hypothetical protein